MYATLGSVRKVSYIPEQRVNRFSDRIPTSAILRAKEINKPANKQVSDGRIMWVTLWR